jgi:hypothetical protein
LTGEVERMALNYGISDHEASWDGAMKYAEVQGWTLANVSPLYLIYLTTGPRGWTEVRVFG